jgi:hypothetical protein
MRKIPRASKHIKEFQLFDYARVTAGQTVLKGEATMVTDKLLQMFPHQMVQTMIPAPFARQRQQTESKRWRRLALRDICRDVCNRAENSGKEYKQRIRERYEQPKDILAVISIISRPHCIRRERTRK